MPADPPTTSRGGRAPAKPCPICGKPATPESRPFCSERCRDVDLNRWLSGAYVVPSRDTDPEDAD
ncbi:MAG: DNA gyrase inhibitor YacG [Rhizobiales bacterium]|nr:DNA gyrase inhibitor YacG [Hyphomicrobiales bacterium]